MNDFVVRLALAATVVASFGAYHLLNASRGRVHRLVTGLDRAIPFVPAFSVPYMLYFPFLFGTVLYGILATPYWQAVGVTLLVIQAAALLIYAGFQTHVPRPETGDGLFDRLTRHIYVNDRPYNCFPSLHVAHSSACFYWMATFFPVLAVPFAVLAAFIVLSTVFIKQHAIVDVIGGFAAAAAGVSIALHFV